MVTGKVRGNGRRIERGILFPGHANLAHKVLPVFHFTDEKTEVQNRNALLKGTGGAAGELGPEHKCDFRADPFSF